MLKRMIVKMMMKMGVSLNAKHSELRIANHYKDVKSSNLFLLEKRAKMSDSFYSALEDNWANRGL